jgi:ZIP family zinc transporter
MRGHRTGARSGDPAPVSGFPSRGHGRIRNGRAPVSDTVATPVEAVALTLVATGTALATGIGALPVLWLGYRVVAWAPALWGVAGGVMTVASIAGLVLPGLDEGSALEVGAGLVAGALALGLARARLNRRDVHLGGLDAVESRRAWLVAGTLFAHSLPEGLAIGAAWASDEAIGIFVVVAIALQNVPEGMVTALPLTAAGLSPARIFWAATATSAPQIPGALLAYWAVTAADRVLGFSFGLAAGAMLALVAREIAPAARERPAAGAAGAIVGAAAMILLAQLIGV